MKPRFSSRVSGWLWRVLNPRDSGIGTRGVYGALSPGQTFPGMNLSSFTAEFGQMYKPSLGPPNLNFFGTGPTAFGAAGAPALAGSGASTSRRGSAKTLSIGISW
jgi:hypothetical protein